MFHRTYVWVTVQHTDEGVITPLTILWDGRSLIVDSVLNRRPAAAAKAGGQGMRYTVCIGSHQTYLFEDDQRRWFVEEHVHVYQLSCIPRR